MSSGAADPENVLELDPARTLLRRVRAELGAAFGGGPVRLSRAPGRLDVMGGIAEYTGSLVLQAPIVAGAAVALQPRTDRELQIFSFNLFDEHLPFTFRMPLDALARGDERALRREFAQPGRKWAAGIAGCLFVLHRGGLIDLLDPRVGGLNLATLSSIPAGAGLGSSAAMEAATMLNLVDHFSLRDSEGAAAPLDGMKAATLCREVERQLLGRASGIAAPAACFLAGGGRLLRMLCQPRELQPALEIPRGVRIIGIDSGVRRGAATDEARLRTHAAAIMARRLILATMRDIGAAADRELIGDPLRGYLANLRIEDYKAVFRPRLPARMSGREFEEKYGAWEDEATTLEPDAAYEVVHAADHHVLEANRVRRFAAFLEQAGRDSNPERRGGALDRAGHLMYASHLSYGMDAMLGSPACDRLVELVRRRERAGFYGARITAGGGGGTVVVLADERAATVTALKDVCGQYHEMIGLTAHAFATEASACSWEITTRLA